MATPYYGTNLNNLQSARTASEEIAGRLAMQKMIEETARLNAQREQAQRSQAYDLQRQQLAQQGQYQQGMLNRYNTEAINRAANEMFDRERVNKELALREREVGFRDPALANPIQMRLLEAKQQDDAREKAAIEQAMFIAAQNSAGSLNQAKAIRYKLFALDSLQPELDRRINEYDGYLTKRSTATKRAGQEMMSQFPQGYTANTNAPFADNMTLARSLFGKQLEDLKPMIEGISPEVMNRIQPTETGYVARSLFPMTSTATLGVAPAMLTTSNLPPITFGSPATNAPVSVSGLFPSNTVTANAAPAMSASQPTQLIRSPDGRVAIQNREGMRFWAPESMLQMYLTNGYSLAQ